VEQANQTLSEEASRGGACRSKPGKAATIEGEAAQGRQAVDADAPRAWVHRPLRW
jgi:hypothetical protein